MKLITANKLNRFFNRGVLPKLLEKLDKTKVLKTMEEVSANTNPENIPNALVVGELYNNLKGFEPVLDETGRITGYKTSVGGADTVFPFSSGLVEYIDGNMDKKVTTNDTASVSKTYAATSNGTLLIFGSITYTKAMTKTVKLNGVEVTPTFYNSATGVYSVLYSIPVKENDNIQLSFTATNTANYLINSSYFMVIVK